MSGVVFAAVLAAALLHASWNAIAKALPDQWVAAGAIGTLVFREPFRVGRLVATAGAVAGIALLAT